MVQDAAATDGADAQRLRFPRLHWLAWLTLLASTIVVTLLVVPGLGVSPTLLKPQPFMWGWVSGSGPVPDPDLAVGPLSVEEYEHGWPIIYLHRAVGAGGKGWPKGIQNGVVLGWPNGGPATPWNCELSWSFSGDVSQWNTAGLAADALIALALIAAPTWACQWWIVRRGGRLRVRIVDLLVAAAVFAAVLGWRQSHMQLQAVEERLITALPGPGANLRSMWHDPRWENCGPRWFERLLGLGNYHCFRHLTRIDVIADEMVAEDWNLLSQASYVREIRLWGSLSAEAADAFATLQHLRKLTLCSGEQYSTPADELQRLSRLGSVKCLILNRSDLLIEDMDAIAAIPTVQAINVRGILATIDEQHAFRDSHPHLAVTCDEPSFDRREVDPWELAYARLIRWRNEDSVTLKDPDDFEPHLDLRGISLKPERLQRLQPVMATTSRLKFDGSAVTSAVIELLRKCRSVTRIDAAGLPADHELLEQMAGMPSLEEIGISQGSASAEDFLQLQRLKRFYALDLYETTFPEEELSKLLSELNPVGYVEAYRGLDDATPAIVPVDDPDDPFGAEF